MAVRLFETCPVRSPSIPDPAAAAAAAALECDPFYRCLLQAHEGAGRRRRILEEYFAFSIAEGEQFGRTVHLADPALGVAVWLLPQNTQIHRAAAERKREFLRREVGARGAASYERIVDFMSRTAKGCVGAAWYLSIVAVDPKAQGRGLGRQLLAPTLAEADAAGAVSYLETFGERAVPFYERLGFVGRARAFEPSVRAEYRVLVRAPARAAPEGRGEGPTGDRDRHG